MLLCACSCCSVIGPCCCSTLSLSRHHVRLRPDVGKEHGTLAEGHALFLLDRRVPGLSASPTKAPCNQHSTAPNHRKQRAETRQTGTPKQIMEPHPITQFPRLPVFPHGRPRTHHSHIHQLLHTLSTVCSAAQQQQQQQSGTTTYTLPCLLLRLLCWLTRLSRSLWRASWFRSSLVSRGVFCVSPRIHGTLFEVKPPLSDESIRPQERGGQW